MEITNETKAKVFAQYLGQQMGYYDGTVHQPPILSKFQLTEVGIYLTKPYNRHKLILKPLSAISDEDAIKVFDIVVFDPGEKTIIRGSEYVNVTKGFWKLAIWHAGMIDVWKSGAHHPLFLLTAHQFLQSRGYDLPNYLLDGKTLHQSGLAIYE